MTWPLHSRDVPSIDHITPERFAEEYVRTETPLLVKGLIPERVRALADPAVLAERHGDSKLKILSQIPKNFLVDFKASDVRDMNLTEFVRYVASPERELPCYANQQPLNKFPSLDEVLTYEPLVPGVKPRFLWLSSKDANIGLHFDPADGFLCQLYGRKRFYLIRHADSGSVYPFDDDVTRSTVDLRHFDLERHPRLRDVVPYVGEMGPGDLLYIPRYTWHYFWGISTSVSANAFQATDVSMPRVLSLLRMYGARYVAGVLGQMVRYGLLNRPYERRGYGWPPAGLMLWNFVADSISSKHVRR